jgi:hypothetical protein
MLTRKELGEGWGVEKSSHVLMSHLPFAALLVKVSCMHGKLHDACTARPFNVLRFRETRTASFYHNEIVSHAGWISA